MKRRLNIIFMGILLFTMDSCIDNNISFDEQINVAEGVYISGSASEFSAEVPKGQLANIKDGVLYSLNVWLKTTGNFKISYVGNDGQPVSLGSKGEVSALSSNLKVYGLSQGGDGITVPVEGLYKIVVNTQLDEVNVIPLNFKLKSELEITEQGTKEIGLDNVSYDNLTHVVTWKSGDGEQLLLPTEYMFTYGNGEPVLVRYSETQTDTIPSVYTGVGANIRTNVLTNEYSALTNDSKVSLKLKHKGNYIVNMQYSVLSENFTAKIDGDEIIEPEAQGYAEELYMGGENFGGWNSNSVRMIPVGVTGNGAFWTIQYFTAGKGIEWSGSQTGDSSFASQNNNVNFTLNAQGKATVTQSGYYLVYVDLPRKLISFETPEVYGMGECFNGDEQRFVLQDDKFVATTTSQGNLKMFAVSKYNDREWNSMEFNIYKNNIEYRGVNAEEQESVPVARNIPIRLDFMNGTATYDYAMSETNVPESATALYLTGDDFGDMNWGSPLVETFDRSYSEDYRWFYVNYFRGGTGVRFATEKCFGGNEFVELKDNGGYTVRDGKAIIPEDGIYMIFVDLSLRMVYIQKATIYGYAGSSYFTFSTDENGKTVTATLPADGRVRTYAKISKFSSLSPKFSEWKRELAVNPETGELAFRKLGEGEPNKNYTWKAGTKLTYDFLNKKGIIVEP